MQSHRPRAVQNHGDEALRDGVSGLNWASERSLPILMILYSQLGFGGNGGCRAGVEDQQLSTAVSEVCSNGGFVRPWDGDYPFLIQKRNEQCMGSNLYL